MPTPIPGLVIGKNPAKVETFNGGVHIIDNSNLPIGTAVWILWNYEDNKPVGITKRDELLSRGKAEQPSENEDLDYLEDLEVASLPLSGPGFLEDEDWDLEL